MMTPEDRIRDHLNFLYGEEVAERIWPQIQSQIQDFQQPHPELIKKVPPPAERLTEQDAFLITYADQFTSQDCAPLEFFLSLFSDGR